MVTGGQAPPPSSAPSSRSGSGHDGWIKRLKKSTKVIVKFIEGYSRIRPLEAYGKKLKGYASWVKCLKPSKLKKLISSYCSDLSPRKVIPGEMGLSVLCLWLPILLTCLSWLLGLSLVLTIPPATFLLALLGGCWAGSWPSLSGLSSTSPAGSSSSSACPASTSWSGSSSSPLPGSSPSSDLSQVQSWRSKSLSSSSPQTSTTLWSWAGV